MVKFRKHPYWSRQIDGVTRELSKLAIVCDVDLGSPGFAERVLRKDESVCGNSNPEAFRQLRQHLMALFNLEQGAIERLGPEETRDILDQVRAAIVELRQAGSDDHSLPSE